MPARRCWSCTISIPREKRLTPDRRARCPRRSTNSTSFSSAWDQAQRHNDAANPSTKEACVCKEGLDETELHPHVDNRFPPDHARGDWRVGAAEANDGLRASQWTQHVLRDRK